MKLQAGANFIAWHRGDKHDDSLPDVTNSNHMQSELLDNGVKRRRAVTACVCPNFIHSLDAYIHNTVKSARINATTKRRKGKNKRKRV